MSGVQQRHVPILYYIMLYAKRDRDRIVSGAQHEFSDGKRQGRHVGVKHWNTIYVFTTIV